MKTKDTAEIFLSESSYSCYSLGHTSVEVDMRRDRVAGCGHGPRCPAGDRTPSLQDSTCYRGALQMPNTSVFSKLEVITSP